MGPWSKLYHSGLRRCDWASTHLIGPVGMKKRCQKGTPHSPPADTAKPLAKQAHTERFCNMPDIASEQARCAAGSMGAVWYQESP